MDLSDCEKYVNIVKNHLDNEWLKNELEKIQRHIPIKSSKKEYEKIFHPLALRIKLADEHIAICKRDKKRNISEEIFRTALLGLDIETLEKHNVKGLSFELKKLQSEDHHSIEKTIYEIQIASLISKNNHVEFIDPNNDKNKTYDLLINNTIEVECKKKDPLIDEDKKIEQIWKNTEKNLEKLIDKKSNYLFVIRTFSEPTEDIMNEIINKVSFYIKTKNYSKFSTTEYEFQVLLISKFDSDLKLDIEQRVLDSKDVRTLHKKCLELITNKTGFVEFPDLTKFENRRFVMSIEPYNINGNIFLKNFNVFYFNTNEPPKRLSSIISSLKQAKDQITRTRPAIIAIDISIMSSNWNEDDLKCLRNILINYLKNNLSISGIILTREWFPEDDEKISYFMEPVFLENQNARMKAPNSLIY